MAEPLKRSPSRDPYVGSTLDDRYVVERCIGQGGMGVVYAARHKVIDKRFAIKILRVEMVGAPDLVRRFLNEARAASSIGNPHIVDVVDFGQLPDGAPYFVMEYLEGESLAARMMERRGLPAHDVMRIASEVANGLHAAHQAGIVHRDLKPDNVMLKRGAEHPDFVKVLDFGIAKVSGESKRLTMAGSVFGTPHYMSPEQAEGKTVDRRTDIYSLGVMMYEMTVGHVPFDAESFMGILSQHMHKAPTPVRQLRPDVPPALDAVIEKCMAKDPRGRFATMTELVSALGLASQGIIPAATPSVPRGAQPSRGSWADRSGGYAAVGATPARRGLPRAAWIALGVVALSGAGLVAMRALLHGTEEISRVEETRAPPGSSERTPSPSAIATNGSSPRGDRPAVDFKIVTIIANPLDATIRRDDIDVGMAPKDISIAPGETAKVTVSRDAYVSRTVTVDGSKPRIEVQLMRVSEGAAPPRPTAPAKPLCPSGERMIKDHCERF